MISCFPEIYPDELLYSQLARYFQKSGYIVLVSAVEDLYARSTTRPDMEFLNEFTDEALSQLTKTMSMEELILKHTMFPFYGRFIDRERRIKALDSLAAMNREYVNLLPRQKRKDRKPRYLRYCPVCAKENREVYGETYWNRIHQITGMKVCPVHGCYLKESTVPLHSNTSPMLVNAEEAVPEKEETVYSEKKSEICFARYMMEVLQTEMEMDSDVSIGKYLHSKMANTKYVSLRGKKRYMALLHQDFIEQCGGLLNGDFTELWQIQKIFSDDRCNFQEICLLSMFLGVEPAEFGKMRLPEKTQQQVFDEKVHELHRRGLKYPEIARQMDASYEMVKTIGTNRYGTYHYLKQNPQKGGIKKRDWQEEDVEKLPLVKEVIRQLQGDGVSRPRKISVGTVERLLGLPDKRMVNLPRCRAEIMKYRESQEEYWAREAVWAAEKTIRDGRYLNAARIMKLTNMRKRDITACLPYIGNYTDGELEERIYELAEVL